MISLHLDAWGHQSSARGCCRCQSAFSAYRTAQLRLERGAPAPARDCHNSGSNKSTRPSIQCRAESESGSNSSAAKEAAEEWKRPAETDPVGGYTPAEYITFSDDENRQCHHHIETEVDAPLELCYSYFQDWTKLLDFMDLVGQIGLDGNNPNMALFQCYYRYRKLPLMEIAFLLEREERQDEDCKSIVFRSVYGMPMKGQVQFYEQTDGLTRVRLYFTHPVPNLLVQMQIGPFGLETDLQIILRENMTEYTDMLEAAAPQDWQDTKQQVAERAQQRHQQLVDQYMAEQQQQEAEEQLEQEQQAHTEAGPQQDQQDQQQQTQKQQRVVEQEQQQDAIDQQQQQADAVSAAADKQQGTDGPPDRGARRSTKAQPASAETGPAAPSPGPQTAEEQAAAAAAAKAPAQRGRKSTRAGSVSKAPAGAAASDSSKSSSSAAARRRSRMTSNAANAGTPQGDPSTNGTGPVQPSSGSSGSSGSRRSSRRSTTRRPSRRSSTAAKE